jgi:fatty acid desaturase
MTFSFQFSSSWYILFAAFLLGWLAITIIRRKQMHKKEVKQQLILALFGMMALASMEFFSVSMNLWNYLPANWPVILWPTYFAAILFGYQLLRLVEKITA